MISLQSKLRLQITKRTDPRILERMSKHYSQPKGFVGRNICYAIEVENYGTDASDASVSDYYGHIVAGSATKHLPNRNEFMDIGTEDSKYGLNNIINNIFYNVSKVNNKYPMRNFTTKVLKEFMKQSAIDWEDRYGDKVIGFESLILPERYDEQGNILPARTGELYRRAGWELIGKTKGYTCKRVKGKGTDSWSGKRVWDTKNLKPKLVYAYKL